MNDRIARVRAQLIYSLGNKGIGLDKVQPDTGLGFIGMGNKRRTTVLLPVDVSESQIGATVESLCREVEAGLRG